jgi:uncharacterized protein (DUF1778 family)
MRTTIIIEGKLGVKEETENKRIELRKGAEKQKIIDSAIAYLV